MLPKNGFFVCAICKIQTGVSDTYFIRSAEYIQKQPVFGTLFLKSRILLTQNTFSFIIWILPVHRLFTNQYAGRKEGVFPMSLNLKNMSTETRNQNTMRQHEKWQFDGRKGKEKKYGCKRIGEGSAAAIRAESGG